MTDFLRRRIKQLEEDDINESLKNILSIPIKSKDDLFNQNEEYKPKGKKVFKDIQIFKLGKSEFKTGNEEKTKKKRKRLLNNEIFEEEKEEKEEKEKKEEKEEFFFGDIV